MKIRVLRKVIPSLFLLAKHKTIGDSKSSGRHPFSKFHSPSHNIHLAMDIVYSRDPASQAGVPDGEDCNSKKNKKVSH
jgi:hypothetical protein